MRSSRTKEGALRHSFRLQRTARAVSLGFVGWASEHLLGCAEAGAQLRPESVPDGWLTARRCQVVPCCCRAQPRRQPPSPAPYRAMAPNRCRAVLVPRAAALAGRELQRNGGAG